MRTAPRPKKFNTAAIKYPERRKVAMESTAKKQKKETIKKELAVLKDKTNQTKNILSLSKQQYNIKWLSIVSLMITQHVSFWKVFGDKVVFSKGCCKLLQYVCARFLFQTVATSCEWYCSGMMASSISEHFYYILERWHWWQTLRDPKQRCSVATEKLTLLEAVPPTLPWKVSEDTPETRTRATRITEMCV